MYTKSSGLETLIARGKEGSLHQSEQPELNDKRATQSAILLFSASSYINWNLQQLSEESDQTTEFGGIPEVSLARPTRAIQCAMYYLVAYVERSKLVQSPLDFLNITKKYFESLEQEIVPAQGKFELYRILRAKSLQTGE